MYRAFCTRATPVGPGGAVRDNGPLVEKILALRNEKARLLDFRDFSDLVLDDRMAHSGARAQAFLDDLREKTERRFREENQELEAFAGIKLQPWDVGYWAEKQRAKLYDFDEEALRPYFPLERVVDGMFDIFGRLLGIKVTREAGVPAWDSQVNCYAIHDGSEWSASGFVLRGLVSSREQARRGLDGRSAHGQSRGGQAACYSDQAASAPCPASAGSFQGAFGVGGTDPSVNMPAQGSSSSNFWIDLQVSDTAPVGYSGSYRLWPNFPTVFPTQATIDTQAQTVGTQFSLSEPCTVNNVWFYSPPFAQDLPASTQIWNATHSDPGQRYQPDGLLVRRRGQRMGGQFLRQRRHRPARRELHRDHVLRRRQGVLHGVAGLLRLAPGRCRACHQRHGQRAAVVALQRERVQPPRR